MTIRDKLQDMRRKSGMAALIGWPMCAAGVVLAATVSKAFMLLFIPGLILFGGGVVYMLRGIRCPRCHGPIGFAISHPKKGRDLREDPVLSILRSVAGLGTDGRRGSDRPDQLTGAVGHGLKTSPRPRNYHGGC